MADLDPKRKRAVVTPTLVDEPVPCPRCIALAAELAEARTAIAALQARRG